MNAVASVLMLLSVSLASVETILPVADARCQVRLKYSNGLGDPTWDPETPLNNDLCEGGCRTSGACRLSSRVVSETQTDYWCECPSGTGDAGCRGTIVRLRNHVGYTLKLVCSDGGCADNQVCDWTPANAVGSRGTWAKCGCQQ
jgi:hypothetical protein